MATRDDAQVNITSPAVMRVFDLRQREKILLLFSETVSLLFTSRRPRYPGYQTGRTKNVVCISYRFIYNFILFCFFFLDDAPLRGANQFSSAPLVVMTFDIV